MTLRFSLPLPERYETGPYRFLLPGVGVVTTHRAVNAFEVGLQVAGVVEMPGRPDEPSAWVADRVHRHTHPETGVMVTWLDGERVPNWAVTHYPKQGDQQIEDLVAGLYEQRMRMDEEARHQ